MEECKHVVYMHTSPSGKSYIGLTKHFKRRTHAHANLSSKCMLLTNAIQKYGWQAFRTTTLATNLTLREANALETQHILGYNTLGPNGYNLTTGGDSREITEATRRKLSEARKKTPLSEETKRKISASLKGRKRGPLSEETRQKILAKTRGIRRGNFTEETRRKMKESHVGRTHSPETRQKISAAKRQRDQLTASSL